MHGFPIAVKDSRAPTWDFTCYLHASGAIRPGDGVVLIAQMFDWNRLSASKAMGQVLIPLGAADNGPMVRRIISVRVCVFCVVATNHIGLKEQCVLTRRNGGH